MRDENPSPPIPPSAKRAFQLPGRSERAIDREVDEELAFHIEARTEELITLGHSPAQARAMALRQFGDLHDARTYISRIDRRTERERNRRTTMEDLRQDVAYAIRKLVSAPGFALTAILTLALGVGANTAIFSVVNGVLFKSLPFPRSEQLYQVWSANPTAGLMEAAVSPPDLDDWRSQKQQIAELGGYWYASNGSGTDLTGLGTPQRLSATFVEPGFFRALGVQAMSGRLPREDEMVRGGRDRVVVLSHAFWQRQFGGDPSIVGKTLTLGREPHEVLGVLPRDFTYPAEDVEVYIPYSTIPDEGIPRERWQRLLAVVARAKDGVTQDQVTAELQQIVTRLAQAYPKENAAWTGVTVKPLREAITGNVRVGLLVLLGAVGFVLLMTCVNVASLLLARATSREREIAVRVALGAGRGRVVRQLLTESVVLSLISGVAGLAVAWGGMKLLLALAEGQLPRGTEVQMDGVTLAYALGIALLTGLLFGLVPAMRASSGELQQVLRSGGRGVAAGGNRLRYGLVISEVALSMALVVGGGLMVRSFLSLLKVDPGFRPENLLVVNFSLDSDFHKDYRLVHAQMLEAVRRLPGVVAAGGAKDAPLKGMGERWPMMPEGFQVPAGQDPPMAQALHVSDGFFNAIGAKIVSGREFTPDDREGTRRVFMVNEAFAKRFFPGENAVGKFINLTPEVKVEIVGVVGDMRQKSVAEPAEPFVYVPFQQNSRSRTNLVVRTRGEPMAMAGAVRDAIWSVYRDQPITATFTYDDALYEALARPRLLTVLLGVFGVIGLALGALGLYGVLAYLVSQRQREIGVRLALGARPADVLGMIVKRGLGLTSIGIAIGAVLALALGRFLAGVLYGVSPTDPATMVLVTLILLTAAALASWIPARRAARVDPAVTLREE